MMRPFPLLLTLGLLGLVAGCNGETDDDGDGVSITAGDCNDADPSVFPGAEEACDDQDSNCDGSTVDGFPDTDGDATPDCIDDDDDGDGTPDASDCAPLDAAVSPDAADLPDDGIDQDCNGLDATTCFEDGDGDGAGTEVVLALDGDCDDVGEASTAGDCDDSDPSIHPTATEGPGDGIDQDCDGQELCYVDADDDGYRTDTTVASSDLTCTDPGLSPATDPTGDCDDTAATLQPGAVEVVSDGIDQDCDGGDLCYVDADGDGYRIDLTIASSDLDCTDPGEADVTTPANDCDDTVAGVGPGSAEVTGDGIDQDCDGQELCYVDADDDGYRTDATVASSDLTCTGPGLASPADPPGDCDDTAATIQPGAAEVVSDGIDQDCDGGDLCYVDADGDGIRTDATVVSLDLDCADPGEAPAASSGDDCDDTDPLVRPGVPETSCDDQQDDDCDTAVDCADDDCASDAACTSPDYDGLLEDAYATTCCNAVDWGYADATACEADAATLIADDCLVEGFDDLDTATADCLIGVTETLNACLDGLTTCDAAAQEACFDSWADATSGCGADGWIDALCPETVSCDNGAAEYTLDQTCDGVAQCADGQDELDCLSCDDGTVIPAAWACDGVSDCIGATDEVDCLVCDDGEVFPGSWSCDGIDDCATAEDESTDACFLCEAVGDALAATISMEAVCDDVPDCPLGDDESGCDRFACDDGGSAAWEVVCDGVPDCTDGSDESVSVCQTFTCDDGATVGLIDVCDGYVDCADASDELGCPTYTCFDGEVVPDAFLCDGVSDCIGGEDEAACGLECASVYSDATSIPESWVCDGIDDCTDGVDEVCATCDVGDATYHVSRNCDGFQDCAGSLDERCQASDWVCDDGATIPGDWLCDGFSDCTAGEDETLCVAVTECPGRSFLHSTEICDGVADCTDGSDESVSVCGLVTLVNPPAPPPSGDCDALAFGQCDGVDDCSAEAGSALDELGCATNRCTDGTPFPEAARCDGHPDCFDGSDEAACDK